MSRIRWAMLPAECFSFWPSLWAKSRQSNPQGRKAAATYQHDETAGLASAVTSAPPPTPTKPHPALDQAEDGSLCSSMDSSSAMNCLQLCVEMLYMRSDFCTRTCCSLGRFEARAPHRGLGRVLLPCYTSSMDERASTLQGFEDIRAEFGVADAVLLEAGLQPGDASPRCPGERPAPCSQPSRPA